MEFNFCRRCGQPLAHKQGNLYICPQAHEAYDMPVPGGGVLFLNNKNEALITIRAVEPAKGKYDLPGGFCDLNETHEQAAIREIREEIGLEPQDHTPLQFLTEAIDYYDYKGETKTVVAVIFWARLTTKKPLQSNDDVGGLEWVPLNKVDLSKTDPKITVVRVAVAAMRKLLNV